MAFEVAAGFRRRLLSSSVIDTARGTRRLAREDRQAQAGGSPRNRGIFDPKMLRGALGPAARKMNPRALAKNPVMFVVEVTAALVTLVFISDFVGLSHGAAQEVGRAPSFEFQIAIWLWFTVYFATTPKPWPRLAARPRPRPAQDPLRDAGSPALRRRDLRGCRLIRPCGAATSSSCVRARRSPATATRDRGRGLRQRGCHHGESAPVLKEPGTDIRSSVTGGTTVNQRHAHDQHQRHPGETFPRSHDPLVEGAEAQRTPNEIALSILLSGLTIVFLLATATLRPFGLYAGAPLGIVVLVALLVCLIPTTIGGLLSAIGIAGMDRVARSTCWR